MWKRKKYLPLIDFDLLTDIVIDDLIFSRAF